MKKNNRMILMGFMAVLALVIVGIGYVFLRNMLNEETNKPGIKAGSRPMFYTDAGKEVDFNIATISNNAEVNSIIAKENLEVNVSLQNNYDATTICTYDIFWEWSDNPFGYYKTKGVNNEFTITGKMDGITLFDNLQLRDYNLADTRTHLASYSVINEGNGITALTLDATLNFYKVNANQSDHSNASYPGKLTIDNVSCSEATKLKEKEIDTNNYICLSHENAPFCPEDNLYRVLEVGKDGIKIVRIKEYGTTAWNEDFLDNGLENYIKMYLNDYQNILEEYSWSIPVYDQIDLSLDKALSLEKNAVKKTKAKIGLLSYSDILKYDYLKELPTPYLVLASGGMTYTKAGFNKDYKLGLVYPCLYLNINAVTSKGNGTITSPYYIN